MVIAAKNYGAHYLLSAGLTLFGDATEDCKTLYFNFLNENYPEMLPNIKNSLKNHLHLQINIRLILHVNLIK